MRPTLIPLALIAIALAGCGGGADSGRLATVDGDTIGMDEFHRYLEIKPLVRVDPQNGAVVGTLGFQAMEDLIRQRVLRHLAKDEGVDPTEAQIKDELDFQMKRNPNFLRDATTAGLTVEQIKGRLANDLAARNLVSKGIKVAPAEIDQYIKDNPTQFFDPELVDLLWILVSNEDLKKQADRDLLEGQKFATVAARYSQAEGARAYQGLFPQRIVSQFPLALQEVVKDTGEMKSTDWIRVREGWAKWYVAKKTPPKPIKVDETIRELVRRQIAMTRGGKAIDLEKRVLDKLKASKIEIHVTAYRQPWDAVMDGLRAKQAAKPIAPPTTPVQIEKDK
ncbi:MAG: SurA N-terminal domain-containing protein [Fimbriimonas ginsengisoli]|uniref:peptidylprolyl isomerase n=1 Tax=Fimbriimonas ginsengisoli TaxID=1005039 RepID=A0A931LVC5_FIMGI|nr:SurA N-terminal domain-containing protein [Fimbriimonas ginsengisoli]